MYNLIGRWLEWKLRDTRIKRKFDSGRPGEEHGRGESGLVRAAAVQRRIKLAGNVEEYADAMESYVKLAAEQRCDIIAFPEYNFFDLFGVIPGFSGLDRYLNSKAAAPTAGGPAADMSGLYPVLLRAALPMQNAIEKIMCSLALRYSIYVYTGSYFIREGGQLYNGGAVISRRGEIIGRQKKLHLTDFEERLGISRTNEFGTFSLDIGKVTFPVCMDATYYEVFSLARSHGCDIAVLPIANNEEYRLYRALRGIWPRVQELYVFGIKSALTGWFCGMHFTGKAGIFAPLGITPKQDGVVSISKDFEGDALVVGDIDLAALARARKEDEYHGDCNPEFERSYYQKYYCAGKVDN